MIRRQLPALLLFTLLTLPVLGAAPPRISNGTRILFIGNSLTGFFGPLPQVFERLCSSGDNPITITHSGIGKGMGTLKQYVEDTNLGVRAKIEEGWDIVIVQGWDDAIGEIDKIGNHQTFYTNARIIDGWIKATGAKTGFYMFFPPWPDWHRGPWIRHSNETIARELDAFVVPVFLAFDSVRTLYPLPAGSPHSHSNLTGNNYKHILYHDFIHQNSNGMALIAYTFYAALTGRSPADLPPDPDLCEGGNGMPYPSSMDKQLRTIAWNTVRDYVPSYPLDNQTRVSEAFMKPVQPVVAAVALFGIDGRRVALHATAVPVVRIAKAGESAVFSIMP